MILSAIDFPLSMSFCKLVKTEVIYFYIFLNCGPFKNIIIVFLLDILFFLLLILYLFWLLIVSVFLVLLLLWLLLIFSAISHIFLTVFSSIKSLIYLIAIINVVKLFAIPIILNSFLILTFNYFTLPITLPPILPIIILHHLIIRQLHLPIIIRPLTFHRIPNTD